MTKKVGLFVIGAALLSAAGGAFAADSGFYMGVGVGMARASFLDAGVAGGVAGTSVNNENPSFAWKEYGGYQFNKNVAVELSFADLGKTDMNVIVPGSATVTGKTTINGFGIAAVGSFPSTMGLALFGKVGGFYSTLNASTTVNIFNSGTTNISKERRFVPNIGGGINYDLTPRIGVRVEYERFLKLGTGTKSIDTDVSMFTVGLNYKF